MTCHHSYFEFSGEVNEVSQHSTGPYVSSDYSCWSDASPFLSFSVDNNPTNPFPPVAPFSLMNSFSLAELIWRRVQPPLFCLSLSHHSQLIPSDTLLMSGAPRCQFQCQFCSQEARCCCPHSCSCHTAGIESNEATRVGGLCWKTAFTHQQLQQNSWAKLA